MTKSRNMLLQPRPPTLTTASFHASSQPPDPRPLWDFFFSEKQLRGRAAKSVIEGNCRDSFGYLLVGQRQWIWQNLGKFWQTIQICGDLGGICIQQSSVWVGNTMSRAGCHLRNFPPSRPFFSRTWQTSLRRSRGDWFGKKWWLSGH